MRNTPIVLTALACLALIGTGAGIATATADGAEPAAQHHQRAAEEVAPLLDEATFAVVRIELDRLDLDAVARWLKDLTPPAHDGDIDQMMGPVTSVRQVLLDGQVDRLYLLLSTLHRPEGVPLPAPIVAMPVEDETIARGAEALWMQLQQTAFQQVEGYAARHLHGMVIIGPKRALDHFATATPAARPELARAFEMAGPAPITLALIVPEYVRRAHVELMPELPAELGGGPITLLTDGMRAVGVGIDLPPRPRVLMAIESADAEAAAAFKKWNQQRREELLAGTPPEFRQDLAEALERIGPHRDGRRLQFEADTELFQEHLEPLAREAIRAADEAARIQRTRAQVANNMSRILMHIHLVHGGEPDDWPESLDELIQDDDESWPLDPDTLRNPRRPDADPGFVYLKPRDPRRAAASSKVIILYEARETWPEGGIAVGFADRRVQWIETEAEFNRKIEASIEAGGGRP